MNATATVNTAEFRRAAKALFETDKRSCVDFINGQALRVVIEAVRQTDKASAAKIEHELGVVSRAFRYSKKTGKVRLGKRTVKESSFAEKILGKRVQKIGHFGFKGVTDIKKAVQKLIASRTRSVAFIKSGWIPARNAFFSVVKNRPNGASRFADAKRYGKPKGKAVPATNAGLSSLIVATIENDAMNTHPKPPSGKGNPLPIAQKGLQRAFDFVTADMMAKLAERLRRDLKPYGAR